MQTPSIPTLQDDAALLEQEALTALETELEAEKTKSEEWRQKYLRALADYHNVTKRAQEEAHMVRQFAGQTMLEKLLPVVDVLKKAQQHCQDQGFDMAMKTMDIFLRDVGVERMSIEGKPFDPYTMECIEVVTGKENVVCDVVEDGYMLHDKLIRPAKVKVGKSDVAVKSKKD